ncbi:hypothetical protein Leryth_000576, partial [Lithospermum erythrorhizon]
MQNQPENLDLMLKESIKHFITSYSNGASDFSPFESIFFRLIQPMLDPPLELTWFYSALTCYSSNKLITKPNAKLLLVRDLFQLILSSSNLSSGVKKIALLAPVVYEFYHVIVEFSGNERLLLRTEVEDLVERVCGYVRVCCESVEHEDDSVVCVDDLVEVWTLDRKGGEIGGGLGVFLPILSDEVRNRVKGKCQVEELAGIVLCEVFWLRLWLKFDSGVARKEMTSDMSQWVVHTSKGSQGFYFLDGLLKMLLESNLPVSTLMSPEDAALLRKTVYDTVISVDYSILLSGRCYQSPDKLAKLIIAWTLVVESATQFARHTSDQTSAISYASAFLESSLVKQWMTNEAVIKHKFGPNICTSQALIKWLLDLEDHGFSIFDDEFLKVCAKVIVSTDGLEHGVITCGYGSRTGEKCTFILEDWEKRIFQGRRGRPV